MASLRLWFIACAERLLTASATTEDNVGVYQQLQNPSIGDPLMSEARRRMITGRRTVTKYRLPSYLYRPYRWGNPPTGAELALMAISAAIIAALLSLLLAPVLSADVRPFVAAALACFVVALVRYSAHIVRRARLVVARHRYHRDERNYG